jgi:hypothetical protein
MQGNTPQEVSVRAGGPVMKDTYTLLQTLFHMLHREPKNEKAIRVLQRLYKQMGFTDAFNAGRRAVRQEAKRAKKGEATQS